MTILNKETINIQKEQDAVFLRNRVTEYAVKIKMGLVNQTKLLTAASELVRNMLRYGGGGQVLCEVVSASLLQTGIRLTFSDKGPGIKDIDAAMKDGFSTGKSLGLGLPGTKRLVNQFEITSRPGKGTTIMILKWKNG
ncbi:MAG TPA: anti-sigma regulatory factor [Chitinophagaceae bacterium]|nr:anti-sigma regulatory factor [Chitinophagaceae bacterium]